jgi:hypothetical protein
VLSPFSFIKLTFRGFCYHFRHIFWPTWPFLIIYDYGQFFAALNRISTMNTLQDTVRAQFEVNKKQKAARLRNNRRISEDDFEDIGYGGYPGRFAGE